MKISDVVKWFLFSLLAASALNNFGGVVALPTHRADVPFSSRELQKICFGCCHRRLGILNKKVTLDTIGP